VLKGGLGGGWGITGRLVQSKEGNRQRVQVRRGGKDGFGVL